MSDGFKRVPSIFNAEPGKTDLDVPKKPKKPFVSSLGKSSKVLADTVKQGSEIAKKSISNSAATVKKATRSLPILKNRNKTSKTDETIEDKVDKLFSSQELLFERLDSEPKLSVAMRKSLASIRHTSKQSVHYIRKQPLVAKVLILVGITVIASSVGALGGHTPENSPVNEVAGATTGQNSSEDSRTDNPSFDVMTPGGKTVNGVEREAPSKDKIYSFADEIGQVRITVTQQALPESFLKESDLKLAEIAKANYYTGVIQIDEATVYHGTSEKTGQQSFVFIRNDKLFFIEATNKLEDDTVVAYILSLQ